MIPRDAGSRSVSARPADGGGHLSIGTYDPLTVTGARFCEARVWSVFNAIADPADFDAAK
jgi:hypothetical protein